MKITFYLAMLLFCPCLVAAQQQQQQATEMIVSLKTTEGKYVGMLAGGGLDASAGNVGAKQAFVLVDLNGGKVADGDSVKIKFDASQWREDKEKSLIHRVPTKGAKEAECVFKLGVKEKLIYFATAAGKFVKVEADRIVTVADAKNASLFDIQTVTAAEQPIVYPVAFKFAGGNHLGMVAGGGLNAAAKEIGKNQIFNLIDLNGGKLNGGDSIKIVFEQSQMREDKDANKIHRVPTRGAKEEECVFKLIVIGKNVLLQTPSGKFVAASTDGKSLVTTDKKDDMSLMTAIPNPTPTVK